MEKTVQQIKKRDGRIVLFNEENIIKAILKAGLATGEFGEGEAKKIGYEVIKVLNRKFDGHTIPEVEQIQDIVEIILIQENWYKTAKAYILYREEHKRLRESKALIGVIDDVGLSVPALEVLKRRYLLKNDDGEVIETPGQMFRRVSHYIALAEKNYGEDDKLVQEYDDKFYKLMTSLDFLPNTPTFTGADTAIGQLSACFVLPVEDSMEGIFNSIRDAALIHQSGGGTGFSFSRLRAKGSRVRSTKGVASGPVSFMKVFNAATEVVKQGGTRRGANMGILRVDHPDILEFITCKEDNVSITNFNISVAVTDRFMEAVANDTDYDLIDPKTRQAISSLRARDVFDMLVFNAWRNGDPGVIFIDNINRGNPTSHIGEIEATNPCGEQPLHPYESCNLGSINVAHFVKREPGKNAEMDWERLKGVVQLSVRFLDNVIDMNKYPIQAIRDMVNSNRRIGLGVMGFADLLITLGLRYDSDEGLAFAEKLMRFIHEEALKYSEILGKERGLFPNFKGCLWDKMGHKTMRNATTVTIAPTGTISMVADCSSGVEPLFAIVFIKNVMDGTELVMLNPLFENIAKERGFYSDELMKKVAKHGSIQGFEEIPEDVRNVFVTAHDINPEWHVRMQAAFQKYVDNAVSKTVNFPNDATPEDVEKVYILSHQLGCKGITVYRDGSRENQVLNIESVKRSNEMTVKQQQLIIDREMKMKEKMKDKYVEIKVEAPCPECGNKLVIQEGCKKCPSCGFSGCSIA